MTPALILRSHPRNAGFTTGCWTGGLRQFTKAAKAALRMSPVLPGHMCWMQRWCICRYVHYHIHIRTNIWNICWYVLKHLDITSTNADWGKSNGKWRSMQLKANYLPDLWVRSSLKLPSTALLDATGSVYEKHKISSFLMQPSPPMAPWISFMRSAFSALKLLMLESWSKWAPQKLKCPKMPRFP